ncbi:hypothetical protein [Roseofilum casamattae]|uniref:Uncharacterized protein n=1 Tax=Roseofilum casamattae BLCC-M143 TaxID=3022442 RepID=A0ABT7BZ15_9CYAN|nr:hypothetical protein [Roseofilum casamattae]MDJ1184310.1 hypothetical protein [Roseofilum casamattae BLCC-M143]
MKYSDRATNHQSLWTFSDMGKRMGRKAKLKRDRQKAREKGTSPENSPARQSLGSTDFVEEIQQQGYRLNQGYNAPEIPQETIKPQL